MHYCTDHIQFENNIPLDIEEIENDHEALCQRGSQLMRTGDLKTAKILLTKSIEVFVRTNRMSDILLPNISIYVLIYRFTKF